MAKRKTLEERIAAAEEQLAALRTKQHAKRVILDSSVQERILRNLRRRGHRSEQRAAAYERLSAENKLKHKKRDLEQLIAEWATREEKLAQYAGQRMPYHVRSRLDERQHLHSRLRLEADILELEGAPPEQIVKLRWAADENLQRGEPVSPDDYEKAHPPQPTPAAAPQEEPPEPREWKPKPPERDVLRDYRGNPNRVHRWLEPEYT